MRYGLPSMIAMIYARINCYLYMLEFYDINKCNKYLYHKPYIYIISYPYIYIICISLLYLYQKYFLLSLIA